MSLSNDEDLKKELITEWLKLQEEKKQIMEAIADTEAELYAHWPDLSHSVNEESQLYFSEGTKKFCTDKEAICELFSIHPDFSRLLSSQPFAQGPTKKFVMQDAPGEDRQHWWTEQSGKRSLKNINPKMVRSKKK